MCMIDNKTPHSPFTQGNLRRPGHTDYPADLLKFNAWINVMGSFEEAIDIILQKKLVLGEPAVVPFNFTHADGNVTLELAFGIGSADPDHPYIKCSITNDIVNEAIIIGEDEEGNPTSTTLAEILSGFITKEEAQRIIDQGIINSVNNPAILNVLATAVSKTEIIDNKINERLRWKPISELLEQIEENN